VRSQANTTLANSSSTSCRRFVSRSWDPVQPAFAAGQLLSAPGVAVDVDIPESTPPTWG
jgi:hypothetical protein